MNKSKCYIVGSGPGAPDLLTVKARDLIVSADVIIYDRLVGQDIINLFNPEAKLIDVGKYPGKHLIEQDEINRIIIRECTCKNNSDKEKVIVRLKGGDPLVFGRALEEIEELNKFDINFEIVPGLSSSYAVPTFAGIPLTARGYGSHFSVITGHYQKGSKKNIFASKADTNIYLMGISNLKHIVEANIAVGKSPDTPTAIIESGTTKNQRVITGMLSTIIEISNNCSISSPAIIIIGEIVKLRSIVGLNY